MSCPKNNSTKISLDISWLRLVEKAQFIVLYSVRNTTNTLKIRMHSYGMQPIQWIWHPVRDASLGRKRIHHDVRILLGMQRAVEKAQIIVLHSVRNTTNTLKIRMHSYGMQPTQWVWHPVRDASLGRKRIHHDVRIPLGMHPIQQMRSKT